MNKGGVRMLAECFRRESFHRRQRGFTIVEVLIVLAITGVLFVSAAIVINGRQNETAFQTSINAFRQQIQQIINGTASGYYPNTAKFTCSGLTSPVTITPSGSNDQGGNSGCIFLGKAIRFGAGVVGASTLGGHNDRFIVYPLAGNQTKSGQEVTNLADARPMVIAPGASVATRSIPDDSIAYTTQYGLQFAWTKKPDGSSIGTMSVIAFLTSFGSYDSNGQLKSGAQQLELYGMPNTPTNQSEGALVDSVDNGTFIPLDEGISVCYDSGTTNQSGVITIGGNGSLTVSLKIQTGKCA